MYPIPYSDEIQQLTRARHSVDSNWLAHDLFVSSDPSDHYIFFKLAGVCIWIFGPTLGTALIRIFIWVITSISITGLCKTLKISRVVTVLGVMMFLALGQAPLGAETIIGSGISKHLSYAFILLSITCWINRHFIKAASLLGLAFSFHILVGFWAAIPFIIVLLIYEKFTVKQWFMVSGAFIISSLPGLIPALSLLSDHHPDKSYAESIFVFFRHPHHLDPTSWPISHYIKFFSFFGLWLIVRRWYKPSSQERWFARFIFVSFVITVCSLILGYATLSTTFLKLHPYRLTPPLLCLAMSFMIINAIISHISQQKIRLVVICGIFIITSYFIPRGLYVYAKKQFQSTPTKIARQDIYNWLADHISSDTYIITNPAWSDVQWKTGQSTLISFKLIPFTTDRIIEWHKRLIDVIDVTPTSRDGYALVNEIMECYDNVLPEKLVEVANQYQVSYIVTKLEKDMPLSQVYHNDIFSIYARNEEKITHTSPKKYLIVRYDDYSPRILALGISADIELETRLFDLFRRHQARLVVGVIPFPMIDPTAEELDPSSTKKPNSWLSQPDNAWVELLREYVHNGTIEPALHGFEHRRHPPSGYRPGEYRLQPYQWQLDSLRQGQHILSSSLDTRIEVFIPPWNAWDENTARALEELEFTWLSPDLHHAEYSGNRLHIAPESVNDPATALEWMQTTHDLPDQSVLVMVTHPFEFEGEPGESYMNHLEDLLSFVNSSSAWRCVGFTDLPLNTDEPWAQRFHKAVIWDHSQRIIQDSFVLSKIISPVPLFFRTAEWFNQHTLYWQCLIYSSMVITAVVGGLVAWIILVLLLTSPRLMLWGFLASLAAFVILVAGAVAISTEGYLIRGVRWQAVSGCAGFTIALCKAWIQQRSTKIVPPCSVVAGNPAKAIKEINPE